MIDFNRFLSRKFIVALVTMAVIGFGLDPELINKVVAIAMMYLGAKGTVDAVGSFNKK